MKSLVTLAFVFAAQTVSAVSGPAYQNLAIMNEIVQSVVKLEDSSIKGDELLQEADDLEIAQLSLKNDSTFSILTMDKLCSGEVKVEVVQVGVGTNPDYKIAGLKCQDVTNGQKAVPWSTIESKIVKRAKTGKITSFVEINQANRRIKLK